MKKKLSILLVVVMLLVTVLCACGDSETPLPDESLNDGVMNVLMATGSTSGTYYGFSGVVAQVLNEKLNDKFSISVEATGASMTNINLIDQNEVQMAIVQNDVMYYAATATDLFFGQTPFKSFSAVMSMYPEAVQIIAKKDITSIDQLSGMRVSVGESGSGVEFNARQILGAYGITFDDIVVNNKGFEPSAVALLNDEIDAAFVVAGAPTTAVTQLATVYDFNVLAVDDEHVAALQANYGFYTAVDIPAGTYSPLTEDVQTVAVMATFIARRDLPDDVVYDFVKTIFECKSDIAKEHSKGELIDPNTAVSGISIPFHPGAEKYYKEQGLM